MSAPSGLAMARVLCLAITLGLCGCGTSAGMQRADDARAAGLRDQAARDYAEALRTEKLTPGERQRALATIRDLTAELVTLDAAAWVESGDPLSVAEPLARLRGRVDQLQRPDVAAAYAAIVAKYLDRNRPALDALRSQHRYLQAVALASALTTPLDAADPRMQVNREVREEARAWHLAEAQAATGLPVAVQFHLGLAHRFGADIAAELQRAATAGIFAGALGWELANAGGECGAELQEVVNTLGRDGARKVRAEFRGVHCATTEKRETRNEAYTYEVAYQVEEARQVADGQESYTETDTRPERVCYSVYAGGSGQNTRYEAKCSTESRAYTVTKYRPKYKTVYVMVTKYRNETGHRDVLHVDYHSALTGEVEVASEGFRQTVKLDVHKSISDTAYTSPHGSKSLARDHTAANARGQAIAATSAAILAAVDPPLARLAATRHAALARTATADRHAALHNWLLTLRHAPGDAEAAKWLGATYGVEPRAVPEVLAGTREETVDQKAAALGKSDLTSHGHGYTGSDLTEYGLERGYADDRVRVAFEHQRFDDVPFQPERRAIQFIVAAQHAVLSRFAQDGFGLGVMDHLHWGLVVGGTSTPTYRYEHAEKNETPLSWGLDGGYALLLGLRTSVVALFLGVDAAYRYRHVGGVAGARASFLPSGRLEWRVNDRHPIIVTGWVGDLLRGMGAGFGADLLLAVGSGSGVVLGWDHELFDARMGGKDPNDIVHIGNRVSNIFTAGYQFGF